ncbi:G4 quadruplex nucleic acid binding protein [Malassezia sp. CBS 17886]|nr:G4 quadruplex nucleic acid binding protein [Malassezia sp. CBS 17886]
MAQHVRQLLAAVYARLVSDQGALRTLADAQTPLRVYAHDIAALTGTPGAVLGATPGDQAAADAWLDEVDGMNGTLEVRPRCARPSPQTLDQKLASRTFLAGNAPTAADYALFASLYDVVATLPVGAQHAHPSLARYFSHMSHLAADANVDPPIVPFDPAEEGFPQIVRATEKKDRKSADTREENAGNAKKKGANADQASPKAAAGDAAASGGDKGAKKGKMPKGGAPPPSDAAPAPSMVDMRIGRIVEVGRHPDADALYLEKVDFGEPDGPRVILSGLVHFVPVEQMRGRLVVGICNLKPAAMRGIKSYGMLLCATSKLGRDGGVEPVAPPAGSEPGDRVYVEGYDDMEPLDVLNPKKKIFEAIQPNYMTTDDCTAAWRGVVPGGEDIAPRVIRTARGVCTAPGFPGATLS